MRTSLTMLIAAITLAGCSDIHNDKAARDPDGISAQAEKLPADERITFEAGAERGDPGYLAANPTVADAISEGKRVRAAEMKATVDRGNELLAKSHENENLQKGCNLLPADSKTRCNAEVSEKMMKEFRERRVNR